jgi:hypothetical protein
MPLWGTWFKMAPLFLWNAAEIHYEERPLSLFLPSGLVWSYAWLQAYSLGTSTDQAQNPCYSREFRFWRYSPWKNPWIKPDCPVNLDSQNSPDSWGTVARNTILHPSTYFRQSQGKVTPQEIIGGQIKVYWRGLQKNSCKNIDCWLRKKVSCKDDGKCKDRGMTVLQLRNTLVVHKTCLRFPSAGTLDVWVLPKAFLKFNESSKKGGRLSKFSGCQTHPITSWTQPISARGHSTLRWATGKWSWW